MTAPIVVIDASAGAELVIDTPRGRLLRRLVPSGASLSVPEHFDAEVAGVIRRWELGSVLTPREAAQSLDRLVRWPVRRAQLLPLLQEAWAYRANMTISDALYVVLAERLGASHSSPTTPGWRKLRRSPRRSSG